MLDALGIPRAMMPARLVASSDVVGRLTAAARRAAWARRRGMPVIAGGVDAAVATLAAGVTRAGQHVAMIGSSMCWGYITPARRRAARAGQHAERLRRPRDTVRVRRRDHRGRRGDVVPRAILPRRDRAGARATASTSTTCSTQRARDVPDGADGVLFLPYLMGERSPVWDGKASGAFVGLTLFHTARASVSRRARRRRFALRHNIEAGARGARRRSMTR